MYLLLCCLSLTVLFGCNVHQASYENTGVGGTVIDSSTKKGLPGVKVSITTLDMVTPTYTDSNGFFYIGNIGVPSSAGNFNVTFEKEAYKTTTLFVILYAGDTTKRLNFAMHSPSLNSVYIINDLVVSEYITPKSRSILNLYHLFVTDDSIWYDNDAILLDSSKTRANFKFYAGAFAQPVTGWDTRFTNILGYYSQFDFDTLSRIDVGPRIINPYTDFPAQITSSFNAPLAQSPVYGFFLLGRYDYNQYYPRVYGLLRIENFYYDNAAGIYKAIVDVKINRNEQNYFLLQ